MTTESLNVYVIACGGDGTTIWIIEELIRAQVDIASVIVGVMPLGTGNDFSLATGFGGKVHFNNSHNYKETGQIAVGRPQRVYRRVSASRGQTN